MRADKSAELKGYARDRSGGDGPPRVSATAQRRETRHDSALKFHSRDEWTTRIAGCTFSMRSAELASLMGPLGGRYGRVNASGVGYCG